MSWLEHRVPPPVVLAIFAGAAALAAWLWPTASIRFSGQGFTAGALLVAGIGVMTAGIVRFRRARTTLNPLRPDEATTLVDGGVFARTRNPMYLGMALDLAALAVWLGHPGGAVAWAGFVAYITRFQIVPEERALRARFGAAFDRYAVRVGRWL